MKNSISLLALVVIIIMSSCSKTHYLTSDFDNITTEHQMVAVVPVHMIFTGRMPKDLTEEQIAVIEKEESLAFQQSLMSNILRSSKNGKKPFNIDFQSIQETNAIIERAGISITDSWTKDPKELARILGVDAVVKTTVEKKRYMSDLASFAIDVAMTGLGSIEGTTGIFLPGNVNNTNDIKVSLSTIDKRTGTVLYSDRKLVGVDWNDNTERVIETVNRRITKRFPYRKAK